MEEDDPGQAESAGLFDDIDDDVEELQAAARFDDDRVRCSEADRLGRRRGFRGEPSRRAQRQTHD